LITLTAEEISAVRRFIAALEHEQQFLIDGDIDGLLPLAEEKNQLAKQLSALAERRQQALTAIGNTPPTMAAWLATLSDPAPGAAWQTLLDLAAQARELNSLNGKLIAERMRHNQQSLAILLAAGDNAALYGPDGQTRTAGGGRALGSA
jgi:flagella synthesis protein FlgN